MSQSLPAAGCAPVCAPISAKPNAGRTVDPLATGGAASHIQTAPMTGRQKDPPPMHPRPDPPAPGQESVWDYPRPPIAEATRHYLRIVHRGHVVAETTEAVRTLETSHPPTWYFPRDTVDAALLRPGQGSSLCEWKGAAVYHDIVIGDERLIGVGWSYPRPSPAFAMLRDHVAFYAAPFDACYVDDERVVPQPGGFYGGWITSAVAGPYKGVPGSRFW